MAPRGHEKREGGGCPGHGVHAKIGRGWRGRETCLREEEGRDVKGCVRLRHTRLRPLSASTFVSLAQKYRPADRRWDARGTGWREQFEARRHRSAEESPPSNVWFARPRHRTKPASRAEDGRMLKMRIQDSPRREARLNERATNNNNDKLRTQLFKNALSLWIAHRYSRAPTDHHGSPPSSRPAAIVKRFGGLPATTNC